MKVRKPMCQILAELLADDVGVILRRRPRELLSGIEVVLSQCVVLNEPSVVHLIQMAFAEEIEPVYDGYAEILDGTYHVLIGYQ